MAPDGALTEWAKLEVQRMIDNTIERYDIKQDLRHRENSNKLDKISVQLNESSGIRKLLAWAFPILVGIISLVVEIIRLTHH